MRKHDVIRTAIEHDIRTEQYPINTVLPRIRDLAEQKQCSIATVRRALDDLTQAGIVRPVKRKGTVVLRKPAAGRVAVLLSQDADTNLLLRRPICRAIADAGYDLDMLACDVGLDVFRSWCTRLETDSRPADAAVVLGSDLQQKICSDFLPVLDEYFPRQVHVTLDAAEWDLAPGHSQVLVDCEQEARVLHDFLSGLGHRQVVIWADHVKDGEARYSRVADHFVGLWRSGGGGCRKFYGAEGNALLSELIRSRGYTAFVDLNDHRAVMTLQALQGMGIRVPEDVTLIGRHNTSWAEYSRPSISSLSFNPLAMAKEVVAAIADNGGPVHRYAEAVMMQRASSVARTVLTTSGHHS